MHMRCIHWANVGQVGCKKTKSMPLYIQWVRFGFLGSGSPTCKVHIRYTLTGCISRIPGEILHSVRVMSSFGATCVAEIFARLNLHLSVFLRHSEAWKYLQYFYFLYIFFRCYEAIVCLVAPKWQVLCAKINLASLWAKWYSGNSNSHADKTLDESGS